MDVKRTIELLFSDTAFGCELGYIPRRSGEDPDDEDRRYERCLKKIGCSARVIDGKVYIV